MSRIHILSNRLPFSIEKENDEIVLKPSVGGLATGMKSIYKKYSGKWIGWSGQETDNCSQEEQTIAESMLNAENCIPVCLTNEEINLYYEGFSNKTIWPLFHYFTQFVEYNNQTWEAYKKVNQKFADTALKYLNPGDAIWIHDYQLLLVPEMIKSKMSDVTIGFFLHIPFPSFEVFRIIPWRLELLHGMLGADLIGFHTYDYERHFFSCIRRLIGYDISLNNIHTKDRVIVVDAFPMGIDYEKFKQSSLKLEMAKEEDKSDFQLELDKFAKFLPDRKLILSIDRLDYTKGIPHRLRAFNTFLEKYPEFRQKVTLVMLAVPSRGQVDHYQLLKKEVDELVGSINGQYGDINFTPIWYFYRSMPFYNLVELYRECDIALITPVRDGMNLVAKEYIASRVKGDGVIILSEMAGVAKEMGEAIIINPNNEEEIADAIFSAITMPLKEQQLRMKQMQDRLQRYDVFKWANEFVKTLDKVVHIQQDFNVKRINVNIYKSISDSYLNSAKRAIFLDYDGTLTSFKNNPDDAFPDENLLSIINRLVSDTKNNVTIISGRDRLTLGKWFDSCRVNLIAEHGVWIKRIDEEWIMPFVVNDKWMPNIKSILENFVDRTPGTFIEVKNFSLVWHYRKAEPEQGDKRAYELKDELTNLVGNLNLEIMEGNKVIEVKNGGVNKGSASLQFLGSDKYDFIMALGDDWTDEYMFRDLPDEAVTIHVGSKRTNAKYKLDTVEMVRSFLSSLSLGNINT
ncbi:MAG: bifunctional alpha,alpha-trehalose-phosphate synthase (UDP-forming)/trehalose-phosphatase [Marinilabiliaceae bacterium]|nr:bifunctional alpha,alpha-trehalose-phosphate synthase (UDP-forming)/trehalose-phosphatase [Marinilabiliaceae bacterium]